MSKVLIDDSILFDIGGAIRSKNGSNTGYKPSEMAAAINALEMGITPSGAVNISQNGTVNVTQYASAVVNVSNSYSASDEGKVVSNGTLVAQGSQAIAQNGTYDTTFISELIVNISSGSGSTNILSGADAPTASVGSNGDIYLKYDFIKKLDYIENIGGGWLTTGYIPNANSKFVMDMELVAPYNNYDTLLGARSRSDIYVAYNGGMFRYSYGNSSQNVQNISSYYGQRVQFILCNGRAAVEQNGTVIAEKTFAATLGNMAVPMGIFTLQTGNNSDTSACRSKGKLYSFKIYENDVLVHDYIPVLDANNVPCIFDVLTGQLYYNLGSGNFSYGNQESVMSIIVNAYCKVNGAWRDLIRTDIDDVNTGGSL